MKLYLSFVFLLFSIVTTTNAQKVCGRKIASTLDNNNPTVSAQHEARMSRYDVSFYHLDVNLERTATDIAGKVRIKAKTTALLDTFSFELHENLIISSVTIDGQPASSVFHTSPTEVNAVLAQPLQAGVWVEVDIFYGGTPPSDLGSAIGQGITSKASPTWGNEVTWTLSQPYAAPAWWPCKQVLSDKADSVYVYVTTSSENKVGSNGLLKAVIPIGDDKVLYKWESRYPIDFYLISIAVAKYVEYNTYAHPAGLNDSILIQNYVYDNPQTLPSVKSNLDLTGPMLEFFSEIYGTYPFRQEKYGHCMAPVEGGMEHQTMTTTGILEPQIIAHELAHQWFGDHVTCATWHDLSLNEGSATYAEYLTAEHFVPDNARMIIDNNDDFVRSELGGSVYVSNPLDVTRLFDGRLTYAKGGLFFHTLRFEVGDSLFFKSLQKFQQEYAFSVAGFAELQATFESVTGKDLNYFFQQWYYGEGFPTFSAQWNQDGDQLIVSLSQFASMPDVTPLFKTSLEIRARDEAFPELDTTYRVVLDAETQTFTLPANGRSFMNIEIDPNNWVINALDGVVRNTALVGRTDAQTPNFTTLRIAPNPAIDYVRLLGADFSGGSFSIIDATGKTIRRGVLTQNYLSVEGLSSGVYLLNVQKDRQSGSIRFVKAE